MKFGTVRHAARGRSKREMRPLLSRIQGNPSGATATLALMPELASTKLLAMLLKHISAPSVLMAKMWPRVPMEISTNRASPAIVSKLSGLVVAARGGATVIVVPGEVCTIWVPPLPVVWVPAVWVPVVWVPAVWVPGVAARAWLCADSRAC